MITTCVLPLSGPRSGKKLDTIAGAVCVNCTTLVENCCPFEAISSGTDRASYAAPARSRTLSTRCSSARPTPVRAPMPKRQPAAGAHVLSSTCRTSHAPSICTPSPSGAYDTSTPTKRPRSAATSSGRSSTSSPS